MHLRQCASGPLNKPRFSNDFVGVIHIIVGRFSGLLYTAEKDLYRRACCLSLVFGVPCYQVGVGGLEAGADAGIVCTTFAGRR